MTLILAVGGRMKWIMTLNLCLMPSKKILDINYTYSSLTKQMKKKILWRLTILLFIREWMIKGGYLEQNEYNQKEKYPAKEMRAYILVSHVINGETWLHGLGGIDVSYHSDIPTGCILGMRFVTWCIVKIYCHVNLFINWNILIVSNDISHLGIKLISWSWLVGDVTKIPDFSDHI